METLQQLFFPNFSGDLRKNFTKRIRWAQTFFPTLIKKYQTALTASFSLNLKHLHCPLSSPPSFKAHLDFLHFSLCSLLHCFYHFPLNQFKTSSYLSLSLSTHWIPFFQFSFPLVWNSWAIHNIDFPGKVSFSPLSLSENLFLFHVFYNSCSRSEKPIFLFLLWNLVLVWI